MAKTASQKIVSPSSASEITTSDTVDLSTYTLGIYIGSEGDVKVMTTDGSVVTFKSMVAGVVYPLQIKRIYSTGTTATSIIGLS